MTLKELQEEGEKEFEENVDYDEAEIGCNWSMKDLLGWINNQRTLAHSLGKKEAIEEVLKEIESERKLMKETHICGFNDGEQNCGCYIQALYFLKEKLKDNK